MHRLGRPYRESLNRNLQDAPVTEAEVRQVVQAVLDAEKEKRASEVDDVALKTMAVILSAFGIEDEDRKEIRADFIHLRKWRKSVEQAQSYTFKTIITVIATGVVGALWMGIKAALGK
jgi:cytochrome P450